MKPTTRKRLLRYGIPTDLVLLATGVGLIAPRIDPRALIAVYIAAVVLSAWKSGWRGGLTATILGAALLFALFSGSVHSMQIGWFAAGGVLVSLLFSKRDAPRQTPPQPVIEAVPEPPQLPLVMTMQRPAQEAATAPIDDRWVIEREIGRAEGERIASERWETEKAKIEERLALEKANVEKRFATEKAKVEESVASARARLEREHGEQLERDRTALRAGYEPEHASLKASFETARLAWDAERADLQKQIEETRGTAAAVVAQSDESALAAHLEQMRAELRHQFDLDVQPRIDAQLAAQRVALERDTVQEIERIRNAAEERVATFRAELERTLAEQAAASQPPRKRRSEQPHAAPPPQKGIFRRLFQSDPEPSVSQSGRSINGEATASRRTAASLAESSAVRRVSATSTPNARNGRVLFLEARRTNADTAAPRLRQLGVETLIVERLADALEEIDRFRPDIAFIDAELPDFERVYKTMIEQVQNLPLILTARNASSIPMIRRADIAVRPYEIDEIVQFARAAVNDPQQMLTEQARSRGEVVSGTTAQLVPKTVAEPVPKAAAERAIIAQPEAADAAGDGYEVHCFNCGVAFDAIEADWCSCLTSDRTLVCTNCLTCFCKAAPSYKEKFWLAAPQRLVGMKAAESRRHSPVIVPNPPPDGVKRPLVMLVEDDEDIQAIVQRVCANLGYGFVSAANGLDGLILARTYRPNLILSGAFIPRLDGREMCRQLKEDPTFATTKMVVMTGLYTDTKYKNEAILRFHIDDYLAKPVSITDLISLLQRHIEGVADLPVQENLHELHRKEIEAVAGGERPINARTYKVPCATCGETFDAAKAEWCADLGRDRTLVCERCGNCFCGAPAPYRQRFWMEAPPVLFERKMIGVDRERRMNPVPSEATRPLLLLVEKDESIRLIFRTVVTTMGYGFIAAGNWEEGHALARQYSPDLIVSDAYLPKREVREIFRLLKEDPSTARTTVIMMTGLYADPVFRTEALSQFNADGYLPKPLMVEDLIRLLKERLPQEVREIAPRPARIITST